MKKLKIISILGTRPEIIRLSRILPSLDAFFNHKIVYTQQSYDYALSEIFFKELRLKKPDYLLKVKAKTVGEQLGNILSQAEIVLQKEKPDAVLILGDTNSALSAIIAKRMHIPIFHLEAGNRSYDWYVPEEINRRIVDHISDYNFAYTEHSRRYLIAEGIASNTVFVIGSPLHEVFSYFKIEIDNSSILEKLNLKPDDYFLLSLHREENVDNKKNLSAIFSALSSLCEIYKKICIVSLHPRTKKRIEEFRIQKHPNIHFSEPFGYFAYNKLQQYALCVLSDSGSIQEESAILNFSAIQIRASTERPEAFDAGSIIVSGFQKEDILNAVNMTVELKKKNEQIILPDDYRDTNVSIKVSKLIMSLLGMRKSMGESRL